VFCFVSDTLGRILRRKNWNSTGHLAGW
jgi:hypothetical protein